MYRKASVQITWQPSSHVIVGPLAKCLTPVTLGTLADLHLAVLYNIDEDKLGNALIFWIVTNTSANKLSIISARRNTEYMW